MEDTQIDLCKRCGAPTFQTEPDKVRIDREGYVSGPRSSSGSTVLGPGSTPRSSTRGVGGGGSRLRMGKVATRECSREKVEGIGHVLMMDSGLGMADRSELQWPRNRDKKGWGCPFAPRCVVYQPRMQKSRGYSLVSFGNYVKKFTRVRTTEIPEVSLHAHPSCRVCTTMKSSTAVP